MRVFSFAVCLMLGPLSLMAGEVSVSEWIMDLSGTWGFRLDPDNAGIAGRWYDGGLGQTVGLPGCLQEQGYGNVPGPNTIWWAGQRLKPVLAASREWTTT